MARPPHIYTAGPYLVNSYYDFYFFKSSISDLFIIRGNVVKRTRSLYIIRICIFGVFTMEHLAKTAHIAVGYAGIAVLYVFPSLVFG